MRRAPAVVLLGVLCGTAALAANGVPPAVRALLKKRMARHAGDMNELLAAAVRVDYPTIVESAGRIAAEPPLARPVTGEASEINAQIPPRFFDLQDELRAHARDLAAAAKERKPERVASTMGALAGTCVRCHALFR
jgi:cytochrome c556